MTPALVGDSRLQPRRRRQAGSGGPTLPRRSTPSSGRRSRRVCATIALIFPTTGRASTEPGAAGFPARGARRGVDARGARRPAQAPAAAGGCDARVPRRPITSGSSTAAAGLNYVGLKTPSAGSRRALLSWPARRTLRPRRAALHAAAERLLPHVARRQARSPDPGAAAEDAAVQPSEIARAWLPARTDFCNLALIDTKTRAVALAKKLEARSHDTTLAGRWSGCPPRGANHTRRTSGLQGCKVKVNGRSWTRARLRRRPRRPPTPARACASSKTCRATSCLRCSSARALLPARGAQANAERPPESSMNGRPSCRSSARSR